MTGREVGTASMARPSPCWMGTEPLLEVWIDVAGTPVMVHLSGVLDRNTGANLRTVVEQVLGEGHRAFSMDIDHLEVPDTGGIVTLLDIERSVLSSGGEVAWSHARTG